MHRNKNIFVRLSRHKYMLQHVVKYTICIIFGNFFVISKMIIHSLKRFQVRKKWEKKTEHRSLQNKIFPLKCRWNGNRTRLAFRDNQNFEFPMLFSHLKYQAIFGFSAFVWTHSRPLTRKNFSKYGFRRKISS